MCFNTSSIFDKFSETINIDQSYGSDFNQFFLNLSEILMQFY